MDVRGRVIETLSELLQVPPGQLTDTTLLVEDLGVSSLDRFELVMGLEDKFGVEMSEADQDKITSIGDIVGYVEARVTS